MLDGGSLQRPQSYPACCACKPGRSKSARVLGCREEFFLEFPNFVDNIGRPLRDHHVRGNWSPKQKKLLLQPTVEFRWPAELLSGRNCPPPSTSRYRSTVEPSEKATRR